jgi:3-hydroxy-3-methylglutaryl CoA synthase
MAVAAGIDALKGIKRSDIQGVYFASTSMPYKERQNAGIITAALNVEDHVRAADFSGAIKAGTTALISAIESVESGRIDNIVVCASDCRLGKPASAEEMIFGDAAAAFVVGTKNVIAEFKGSYSITYDFVDHFRGENAKFDRRWEDRWIRDLGYDNFIPEAVSGLLKKYNLKITDFAKVVYDCHYAAERKKINKIIGLPPHAEQGNLQAEIGLSGTAHPLVMLVKALEDAKPGDKILVVSFGSGCDALYFEATEKINEVRKNLGISGCLANKAALDNYSKYLVWRDILPASFGLRSEEDLWTRFSALWRSRKAVLGYWGGKCRNCGMEQIPSQKICVNPECQNVGEMDPIPFSGKAGHIASYTGDMLAASLNPPAIYGHIEFEGGGKNFVDMTDCNLDELYAGMPVAMSFRRKYYDKIRDIAGYFWKAVPTKEVK